MSSVGTTLGEVDLKPLVYRNEARLFRIALVISVLVWLAVVVGTLGIALLYAALFFVFYLFAQSALISYLRGTATQITAEQFPDLHERIRACSAKLGVDPVPDAYLLHGDGAFNAFATRFLGRNFVVLMSDIVDALESEPEAINFYIGHELGHIRRAHLLWGPLLLPASILPLLGAAYSRAREYTCDRHGLACCASRGAAAKALAALAAGGRRWKTLDTRRYAGQAQSAGGFWMSFHELVSTYPWLAKRMAHVLGDDQAARIPRRNFFAWLLAAFVPRVGPSGGAASLLIVVAGIGILAAVAIPAYQDYTVRAKVAVALVEGDRAAQSVADFYHRAGRLPRSLKAAGYAGSENKEVRSLTMAENGVIQVELASSPVAGKSFVLIPSLDAEKRVVWKCEAGELEPKHMPARCR